MAPALRIERPGGRYHVAARGNERKPIFRPDADRFHFLELLADPGERLGAGIHACVLRDNHFHLLPILGYDPVLVSLPMAFFES